MNIITNTNNEIVGYGDFETTKEYPQYYGEMPDKISSNTGIPLYKFINGEIVEIVDNMLLNSKIIVSENITTERDKRINAGFTYNTKQIACDNLSQNNANAFLTADSLGLVSFPIQWRTIDNTYISIVDSAELKTFASTMLGFVQGIFQESWVVKDNIESATTIAEVETIYGGYING